LTREDAAARELEVAIAAGDLRVALQPVVNLRTGVATRFEALCRWPHPLRGQIAPQEFIADAEAHGLITDLTVQVAGAAATEVASLARSGHVLAANLNVSLGALLDPSFHESLLTVTQKAGCPPCALGIEITESTLMTDPTTVAHSLTRLRSLGMRVEIDDFGTGYSSFGRLIDLPVDALKIERRFVARMTSDVGNAAVVRACIELAHDLGIEAVAEGVETKETLEMLRALGCDSAQGYLFAAPMPPRDLALWVATWRGGDGMLRDQRGAQYTARSEDRSSLSDVLVVDDEPDIVAMLRESLEGEGFSVATATNGMEALCIVERMPPSVVLLDMQMPIVDGPAFARILRARGLSVPIVVMTAGSSASRWARVINADGFIAKPFDVDSVIAVANRFAGKHLTN
jgi:EAL domain-containing protein (putative c-di-GMP-specific phosphodiesterase class I)/ActR/RegA family two-component response regulator